MKVLFVNHNSDLYGASRSLARMAIRLANDGGDVHVVLPSYGPLADKLKAAGITCHMLPALAVIDRASLITWRGRLRFISKLLVSPFQLASLIRSLHPDLVHTNVSVIVASGLSARMTRLPHILHVREFYDEFKAVWPWYRRYLMTTTDRIICVSEAVAKQFPPSKKVFVLHNGFPRNEFMTPQIGRIDAFRRHIHAQPADILVGLPGRIKLKRKGQEVFIRAAALLSARHPEARFIIIGAPFAGNELHLSELKNMARDLGVEARVLFAGEWQDMPAAYAALDVVVLASGQPEPFGGVIIEAMAMGKPVVGTSIGGTPEQIKNRETGLLVPANDADAMAAALETLLSDRYLRENMGKAARADYEKRFGFESFHAKLIEHYAAVAGGISSP
jgi:glycosyltransferase involved in cell wall biosynthesis